FAHICDGRRISIGRKLSDPQFLTGLRVERAEPFVDRRTDEDETAPGRDASPDISNPALQPDLTEFRQVFVDAERDTPRDLTGIRVDCNEGTVRRRDKIGRASCRERG